MSQAHGEYSVTVNGDILIAILEGSFNEEGTLPLIAELRKHVTSFEGKSFKLLINDLELDGMTPEAFMEIERYNQWVEGKHMVAKAVITRSSVLPLIHDKYIPSNRHQQVRSFSNTEDALEWLRTVGDTK